MDYCGLRLGVMDYGLEVMGYLLGVMDYGLRVMA